MHDDPHFKHPPALPPKSADGLYLSFVSDLWESASPQTTETPLFAEVVAPTACWAVYAGVCLGSGWVAPLQARLDDGRVVELLMDDAVVSGGLRWTWEVSWADLCAAEPEITRSMPARAASELVSAKKVLLRAGDRVVIRGELAEVCRAGGYRQQGRRGGLRVRRLHSYATRARSSPMHVSWKTRPGIVDRFWEGASSNLVFGLIYFAFWGGAVIVLLGLRELLRALFG